MEGYLWIRIMTAQVLEKKFVETQVEDLFPLSCQHPRLFYGQHSLARAGRAVNGSRPLFLQESQDRELLIRQLDVGCLRFPAAAGNRFGNAERRHECLDEGFEFRRLQRCKGPAQVVFPIGINLIQGFFRMR